MKKTSLQNTSATYCYSSGKPNTLIMLYDMSQIMSQIFQPLQIKFILYGNNVNQSSILKKQINVPIFFFTCLTEAQTFVSEQKANKDTENIKFYFLSDIKFKLQLEEFMKCEHIKGGEKNREVEEGFLEIQPISQKKLVYKTSTYKKLLEAVEIIKRKEARFKYLPNFISQKKDAWNSNVLTRCILTMINQQQDENSRKRMVSEMQNVMKKISQENELYETFQQKCKPFFQQLSKGPLSIQKSVQWYTKQSPIFKLINSLLRLSNHPAHLFYIQPYFKDLFQAVSSMFKENLESLLNVGFICYRGGVISEEEVLVMQKNIGEIVQNLGFFSTSEDQQTAQNHIVNVMFKIQVKCRNNKAQNCYGFSNISQLSYYFSESEVLFNPLNSFRVLQVKILQGEKIKKYFIDLQYIDFYEIDNQPESQLSENMQLMKIVRKQQGSFKSRYIINQGYCLLKAQDVIEGAESYWRKYFQISATEQQKLASIQNIIRVNHHFNSNYKFCLSLSFQKLKLLMLLQEKKQQQFLNCCQNLFQPICQNQKNKIESQQIVNLQQLCQPLKRNINQNQDNYHSFSWNNGLSYKQINKKIFEFFQQFTKSKAKSIFKKIDFIITFCNIASIYNEIGFYEKSLMIFQKCLQMIEDIKIQNKQDSLCFKNEWIKYPKHHGSWSPLHSQLSVTIMKGMGQSYQYLQNINYSIMMLERCEKQFLKFNYPQNPRYTAIVIQIANSYLHLRTQKHIMMAQKMLTKSLQNISDIFGEQHPQYIQCLSRIVEVYHFKNNIDQALELLYKCLELSRKIYHKNHLRVLINVQNILILLINTNEYYKALDFVDEYLPNVQEQQSKLALLQHKCILLLKVGKYQEALQLVESSIKLVIKLFGQKTNDQAFYLKIRAEIYLQLGEFPKALSVLYQVYQIFSIKFKNNHQSNIIRQAFILIKIGQIYLLSNSKQLWLEGLCQLNKCKQLLSDQKQRCFYVYSCLLQKMAYAYHLLGNVQLGYETLAESQKIIVSSFGQKSIQNLYSLHKLSDFYLKDHQREKKIAILSNQQISYQYCEKALKTCKKICQIAYQMRGQNSQFYANGCRKLGNLLIKLGMLDQAQVYLRKSVRIMRLSGQNNINYLNSLSQLGMCLWYKGNLFESLDCFNGHLQNLKKIKDQASTQYLQILSRKAWLLKQIGYDKQAKQTFQRISYLSSEGKTANNNSSQYLNICDIIYRNAEEQQFKFVIQKKIKMVKSRVHKSFLQF